jgi:hypothetical protein
MKKLLLLAAGIVAVTVIVALLADNSPKDLWDQVLDEV